MVHPNPVFRAQVLGAGPTGALAALALARAGWQVRICDPLPASALVERNRAYAFSHSSQRLLCQLGLWSSLEQVMVPFRSLELVDLAVERQVGFTLADLGPGPATAAPSATPSATPSAAAVGWIAPHQLLLPPLLAALAADPAVVLELGSAPAQSSLPPPDLVVAADGPHSPSRAALGIGALHRAYSQNCLTCLVQLRGSANDQAWELLRPEGPFAVLPLGDGIFQLVWSAPARRCRQLESLGDGAFLDALAGALPDGLQPDALLDAPRAYPVGLLLAHSLHRGRTVLVGESGHRCHPVGGQGLNLCWRDVAQLQRLAGQVVAGRLAVERLPAAYGRRRWPDLLLTLLATDLLVRLFSNRSPLLLPIRHLALLLLARLPPLRQLALAAMTHGPCQLLRQ